MADSRLRILHIATPLTWRGGEQQAMYLVGELAAQGVEQLVACSKGSEVARRCRNNGWKYQTITRRAGFDPFYARHVKQLASRFGATVIHCHDSHAHTAAYLATVMFGNKVPVVVSRRVDFRVKNKRKYNHPIVKRILCVSDFIHQLMANDLRNPSVLRTVHSGVDLSRFEAADPTLRSEFSANKYLIGNVAALADHKDYFTFLKVVRELVDRQLDAHFLIVGDGPDRESIEAFRDELGLQQQVTMTGFRTDIPNVLASLDLFLMTSKEEGLGTSLLDAMASKLPIVATRAGGIPELVMDEKTGLLREVGAVTALANAVQRMLEDEPLRNEVIAGATQHLQQFTVAETARKTREIYSEVVASVG